MEEYIALGIGCENISLNGGEGYGLEGFFDEAKE